MIDAETLAQFLDEEFDKDDWGTIDPWFFKCIAGDVDNDDLNLTEQTDLEGLREVLSRVAERLNALIDK